MTGCSGRLPRVAVLCLAGALVAPAAEACTRAVYEGLNGRYLTGRSMDWKEDIRTNLWALPRGAARSGLAGDTSL